MFKKFTLVLIAVGVAVFALTSQAKVSYFDGSGFLVMKSATQKAQLYRIFNIGDQTIHLDVVAKPVGVQAGYATILAPKNASAFIYSGTQPILTWQCQSSVNTTSALQKVSCDKVLKVSVIRSKNLKLSSVTTNYWLIENKPQAGFKDVLKTTLTHNHLLNDQ